MKKRDWIFVLVLLLGSAIILASGRSGSGSACGLIFCTHEDEPFVEQQNQQEDLSDQDQLEFDSFEF